MEIEYPEDLPRMFAVYNGNCLNPGFHTGATFGDPFTRHQFVGLSNLPLSGKYQIWRGLLIGQGPDAEISIHSMGKVAEPFSNGIAVKSIRLYKIDTPLKNIQTSKYNYPPSDLPRRSLVHLQEDTIPFDADAIHETKMYGINTYTPIVLFYCGSGDGSGNNGAVNWPSNLFPANRYHIVSSKRFEACLEAAQKDDMMILPAFEYGGTGQLPTDAYAVEPSGQKSRYYWGTEGPDLLQRKIQCFDDWYCIDMAHPAIAEDFGKILDEFRPYFQKYPNIKGIELTHRCIAWQISFSNYEIDRFAGETGVKVPVGPQPERAAWILKNVRDRYYQFFYQKKRENLLAIRDKLRSIRPDLVLHVLNWVSDDHLPFGEILYWWTKGAQGQYNDFLDTPGQVCLPNFNDNILSLPRLNKEVEMTKLLEDYNRPLRFETGICPPLYRNDTGIVIWAPVHYQFMADSPTYLNYFRTGEGVNVANFWIYNEDCLFNNSTAWCPGLEGTEHAGPFCMMEEVMAMANVDPPRMSLRMGILRRGFPEYARAFA